MKLFAGGLFFPGVSLVLLSCCGRVQSVSQPGNVVSAASDKTNHTSAPPVVKPETNVTTASPNATRPASPTAVPSTTTTTTTTTAITKTTTTTTTNATTAKTNTTKTSPSSPTSPNVTAITPKTQYTTNSTAATATAKAPGNISRSSGFDVGSFIGGIVLTLGLLVIGYIGCRTYHAKRGVQYRTIDEHDAII